MSPKHILLVAYQCGPGMGSVSQIGWEWFVRLSQSCQVSLVTHIRNKPAIESAANKPHTAEIIYIDTEWFAGPLYRLAKRIFPKSEHSVFLVSSLDYFVFDFTAYRQLRASIKKGSNWELLHRVTPVTLFAPTWFGHLGLPMIIGPLNSGLNDPSGFDSTMKQESTWLIKIRGITRLLDAALGSTKSAARILTANKTTINSIDQRHHKYCQMMLENGVDLSRFTATPWPDKPDDTNCLRILFTGRLIPVKGLDMLLKAVSIIRKQGKCVQLNVIGDGPMRDIWEGMSADLGLTQCVTFHGELGIDTVALHMQACHVFCLPSVRESGGAVLLEAMASARPVIALNFGGPGEIVDSIVGLLLPMINPEQVTADMVKALSDIYVHPLAWKNRGNAGRHRVENL